MTRVLVLLITACACEGISADAASENFAEDHRTDRKADTEKRSGDSGETVFEIHDNGTSVNLTRILEDTISTE